MKRWVLVAFAALVAGAGVWWFARGTSFDEPASAADLGHRIDAVVPASLRAHHVPAAQVAVVEDGAVRWSGAYGVRATTPFQIASVSKTLAAYIAVRLRLDLDAPVERLTAPWRFPASRFDSSRVTLRRLLSHTAGTDVPGYLGWAPGRPLPTTEGSLAAQPVRVTAAPGTEYRYSGGGYTVAQLALERATGRPYAALARAQAFGPLRMRASGFSCTTDHPVAGHDGDGRPLPAYRYAELAAGGTCSTATDLGRLLAALLSGPEGRAMARAQPGTDGAYGLGLHLQRLGDDTRMIWHDGSNRGWQSRIAGFPDRGWGIAVVTNGDGGDDVIADVLKLLVRSR